MNRHNLTSIPLNLPPFFLASQDFLSDFMPLLPHPASVKDINTGKYILVNEATVHLYDLKNTDQAIGLTVRELANLMKTRWDSTYANRIEALDEHLKLEIQQLHDTDHICLTTKGFIKVQNNVKTPVLNSRHKATAIFTFAYDRTRDISWLQLFKLYKKYYSQKKTAIQYFLKFLNIAHHFESHLTEAELVTLMTMKQLHSQKRIASTLGIQIKTVETHVNHIRNKLKDGCLYQLLESLRNESSHSTHC